MAASLAVWPGAGAFGQEGGVTGTLGISQTVRATDNRDLEEVPVGEILSITGLTGSVRSETPSRFVELSFGTSLEVGGEDGVEFGNRDANAAFGLTGPGAELTFSAGYSQTDVDTFVFTDESELDVTDTTGQQETLSAGVDLLLGGEGPATLEASADYRDQNFSGTSDPELADNTRLTLDGTVSLQVDPATELRVFGFYRDSQRDDPEEEVEITTRFGVGATRALGSGVSLSGDVNFTTINTTETGPGGRTTETVDGFAGDIRIDRDLPNGNAFALVERVVTEAGPRDEIRVGRSLEFPVGTLDLEGGLALTDGDTVTPVGLIAYRREVPRGAITFSVENRAALNSDEETVMNTRASAGLTRDLTPLDSVSASVTFANQHVIDVGDNTTRTSLSLSYDRQLPAEVLLRAGVEHRRISETGEPERVGSTVFVTVSRDFDFRG